MRVLGSTRIWYSFSFVTSLHCFPSTSLFFHPSFNFSFSSHRSIIYIYERINIHRKEKDRQRERERSSKGSFWENSICDGVRKFLRSGYLHPHTIPPLFQFEAYCLCAYRWMDEHSVCRKSTLFGNGK